MSFNDIDGYVQMTKWQLIWKQLKLKANVSMSAFMLIILVQLIAVLMSIGSDMSFGTYNEQDELVIDISISQYSGEPIIFLPILSMIGLAFSLSLATNKNMMASYISNQYVNVWTNTIFLMIMSTVIGITSYFLMFAMKMVMFQLHGTETLLSATIPTLSQVVMGSFAMILYIWLFSMLGYFLGEVMYFNKPLFVLLVLFLLALWMTFDVAGIEVMQESIKQFLFEENRISIFFLKVSGITATLFTFIIGLSKNQEVRF